MSRVMVGVMFLVAACGGGNSGGGSGGNDANPPVQPGCGDGVASGAEMCDGLDLRGRSGCQDLGYYDPAPLACTATCELDVSPCTGTCGDGILQPDHEYCDTDDAAGACTDFGFGAGTVGCSRCAPDLAGCRFIGWHRDVLSGEVIDIDGAGDASVYATTSAGVVHFTGTTWEHVDLFGCSGLGDVGYSTIAVVGPGDFWLGNFHDVWHLSPSGCTRETFTGTGEVNSIFVDGPTTAWVVGLDKTWRYDGQSWTSYDVALTAVWAAGPNDVFGADTISRVHHFDGTTWTSTALSSSRVFTSAWGTAPDDVYVAGYWLAKPVVEHFDGTSWTEQIVPDSINGVTSLRIAEHRVFIALGQSIRVLDGPGFTTLNAPAIAGTKQLYASPSGHLYVASRASFQHEILRYDGTDLRDQAVGQPYAVAGQVSLFV